MSETWWPSTAEVASLVTARTIDENGVEQGNFTATTRPTATQVTVLIEQSAALINSVTGGQDIPAGLADGAIKSLVSLRTAMAVELSYFPEQVGGDSSPFESLQSMYRDEFERVSVAIDRAVSDESGDGLGVSAGEARWKMPYPSETMEF